MRRLELIVICRHCGRVSVPSQTGGYPPLSSTTTPLLGFHQLFGVENKMEPYVESQAMSVDDIQDVIGQFVTAARNAIEAGSEGVEIHGLFILLSFFSFLFFSFLFFSFSF